MLGSFALGLQRLGLGGERRPLERELLLLRVDASQPIGDDEQPPLEPARAPPRITLPADRTSAHPVSEAASSPSVGAPLAPERHDRPEAGLLGRVQWVVPRRACMVHTDLLALRWSGCRWR